MQTTDLWTKWFTRIIQLIGAGTFVEQVVVGQLTEEDRPWILLISVAMMLGAQGLRMFLKGILNVIEKSGDDK